MGNLQSNSDQISLEEFKDQIFGIVVFLLSKQINQHLEFVPKEECNYQTLPLPKIASENIYEIALSYYNNPEYRNTEKDIDMQIEEYVNKNILNSKENVTRLYKLLIDKLLPRDQVLNIKPIEIPTMSKKSETEKNRTENLESKTNKTQKLQGYKTELDADGLEFEEYETNPECME